MESVKKDGGSRAGKYIKIQMERDRRNDVQELKGEKSEIDMKDAQENGKELEKINSEIELVKEIQSERK